jgi:5'-3' exonuclease
MADKGSSAFRKSVSPAYKAYRAERYANQTPEEEEKAKKFFEGYEKALELAQLQYPLIRLEKVEADDLAAFIVKERKHLFPHIWLISSDADWDLLLDHNVSRFSFVTRVEYTMENYFEHHGCDTPEEFVSMKVLQGDKGDNVQGVPSIGVKRAYGLIREYGSAMDILSALPLSGKQKFVENLNASGDLILKNYELMDLLSFCEDAISYPDPSNIKKVVQILQENNIA